MSRTHPELKTPPPLPEGGLRIVALGGLGEIGRNMTVFEHDGKLLVVDCGVLFPEEHQPGIDVILPDFTSIRDRLDDIEAIVLTHGHEDHIGGVPYLLRERRDIPLVGSKLTLAFISAKLEEHRIKPVLRQVAEGDRLAAGPLRHRVPRGQPLHPRRAGRRHPHPGRAGAAHRRLQDGPVPARPADHRPARVRPAGRGGGRPLPHRLHQRRGPRLHDERGRPHPRHRHGVPHRAQAGHRLQLRQPRAPHPAGAQRRPRARPQGGLRRALDGPQHGHRPRAGLPGRAAGPGRRPQADGQAPGRPGVRGVHRFAGRADGRAVPDGQPRPRHPHLRGRHRPDGQLAHPGQRERDLPDHQRAHPLGRERRAQGQRQGARLRPRQRRRARLLLQHRQAAQRDARARRVAAPQGQRRAGDQDRRAPPRGGAGRGRQRRRPGRPARSGSPARSAPATSTSTAPRSAGPPRPR